MVRGASRRAIPNIEWLQVVNEPLHDPPDCTPPFNQGNSCSASGNYARALGGANGTDGTGWDWILNAFRLAKQYFPNTKLMINDYSITNNDTDTGRYIQIINLLKAENLIHAVGVQGHAFSTTGNMAQHKANLDRLAATGLPIQVTELDIDGVASGGVPGDEVQLRNYRRIVPTFWEHPGVEGITVWGWRQPNHWRNAQNAPIVLSTDTPKPAAHWLFNYVRGIAPVIRPDQSFAISDVNAGSVGTVQADDWASQIGRPNLRTFTWRIAGGTARALRHRAEHGRAPHRRSAARGSEHDVHVEGARERRSPRERRGRRGGRHRGSRERGRHGASAPPCRRRCRCRSVPMRASARSRRAWPATTRPRSAPP